MRSGIAKRKRLVHLRGVVDSDYRGQIVVMVMNLQEEPVILDENERFAQIIITKIHEAGEIVEVSDLDSTERGTGGFGSTGKYTYM